MLNKANPITFLFGGNVNLDGADVAVKVASTVPAFALVNIDLDDEGVCDKKR